MSGLSRSKRVSKTAGEALLKQVTDCKFWYTYERTYKLRKRKPRVSEILDIVNVNSAFTVVDKTTKVETQASPTQVRKKQEEALFDYLYVANHMGGKTTCHILLDPEKGVTITGEALCHPKLDAFNGKLGRRAARERAIVNALEHLGVKAEVPKGSTPIVRQRQNRLKKATATYRRTLATAGFRDIDL